MTRVPAPYPKEEEVVLVVLPLFHSFGQTVMQNATIRLAGTMVLMARFEPLAAARLIHKHRVKHFGGVPTMYFGLLHHPEIAPEMLASLGYCVSGGSAMPMEVMGTFDRKYGTDILEGYGLSETSPVASFNPPGAKKVGSIGKPIWGVEFRLIDASGQVIDKPDVPGEICIKGHNIMKGYWRRPEATAEAIVDGWFRSGDIAQRDADGYYYIVDRKKDMIIRGGYNVYPREIEEVLYAHPAVLEAAVIGVPHERCGEEVKAVIALKPGTTATADEITAYCKERMAPFKYPREVEFRESLPKGPTGKILKRELRPPRK
jgi:long-chain acyl-CoA synthetase